MKLTRQAIEMVKKLIAEGRAGERPFGVPLSVWQAEIARQEAKEAEDQAEGKEV